MLAPTTTAWPCSGNVEIESVSGVLLSPESLARTSIETEVSSLVVAESPAAEGSWLKNSTLRYDSGGVVGNVPEPGAGMKPAGGSVTTSRSPTVCPSASIRMLATLAKWNGVGFAPTGASTSSDSVAAV